jgi:hypothetical protein
MAETIALNAELLVWLVTVPGVIEGEFSRTR